MDQKHASCGSLSHTYQIYPAGIYLLKVKGTLMQIWKSHYMFLFIWMQYTENFVFLILRILELFAGEFYKFLKK